MDFSFNPKTFRSVFEASVEECLADEAPSEDENSPYQLAKAMLQAIDVMERADAAINPVDKKDITQIGDYTLTLIEGLVAYEEEKTGQGESARDLMRLSIPVAMWIAKHGGQLNHIEVVVNSLAGYANDLREPAHLAELCRVIRDVVASVSDDVRQDLEQTNPMRPWRVLNLNYGIVATRSHDPSLIEEAYASLITNLPQDARQFFREGMQQMDVIGYPQEVREVVEKYDRMWGSDSTLH